MPEWYRDAKFGIFIHWGLYSVPAYGSEWYPREMYQKGSKTFEHHIATYGSQATFGYKDFIPQFKAEKFNPSDWIALFREAGARFVVPVAEHHDGFSMYDSAINPWNAMRMGPHRDVIGELSHEAKKQGLIFGLSSHRAEHWWFFDGGRQFESDVTDPRFAGLYGPARPKFRDIPHEMDAQFGPDKVFLADWLARTEELVRKYHPQLVYFDWWIGNANFEPYRQTFQADYYKQARAWGKGVVIDYKFKAFPEGTAVLDVERGSLATIRPQFWQTDTSVANNSWGHVEPMDYRPAGDIVDDLIDIVSKNGALLLNIGPKSDGTIPEQEQSMLRAIGGWLKVNGDAIYATRPWVVYGEGPTQIVEGTFNDTKRKAYTGQDIRYTIKDHTLFATALSWPGREFVATAVTPERFKVRNVELLGSAHRVKWSQGPDGLKVTMPADTATDAFAYSLRLNG